MITRRRPSHSNHERWLVSYADFITLLFAFFVVLYASAQIDHKKVGMLSESIQYGFSDMGVFGAGTETGKMDGPVQPTPQDIDSAELISIQAELNKSLLSEVSGGEMAVHMEHDGLVITLQELGFFDSGSAQLRPSARATFDKIVNVLKRHPRAIRVEGHTDDVPIHNRRFNSNWELSTARATEVVRVLVTEYGYAPGMLSASGYAEFHPTAENTTETGRQANRRVDIVVLSASHASFTNVR